MNNKWYQSAPCKGILIVLEHILAVVMITCLVFTFSYPVPVGECPASG